MNTTASTASAITDESVARDKAKAVWLAEGDETSEPEAYDRGWKDRAVLALAAPTAQPVGQTEGEISMPSPWQPSEGGI